jgi:hypothetical protein
VEPLDKYLQSISDYTQQQKQLAISWGLLQVAVSLLLFMYFYFNPKPKIQTDFKSL